MVRVLKGQWINSELLLIAATVLREREEKSQEFFRKAKAQYSSVAVNA